jgi:hypothetical protein
MIKLTVAVLLASFILVSYAQIITVNYGCRSYSKDGTTCVLCSDRFYMDSTGLCQPVSSSCQTYNQTSGACLSCYGGYFLAEVICVFGSSPSSVHIDPFCLKTVNQTCTQCSKGFYLLNNTCTIINPLCKSFDYSKLICTGCYSGY